MPHFPILSPNTQRKSSLGEVRIVDHIPIWILIFSITKLKIYGAASTNFLALHKLLLWNKSITKVIDSRICKHKLSSLQNVCLAFAIYFCNTLNFRDIMLTYSKGHNGHGDYCILTDLIRLKDMGMCWMSFPNWSLVSCMPQI